MTLADLSRQQLERRRLLHLAIACSVLLAVFALAACGDLSDSEIESSVAVSGETTTTTHRVRIAALDGGPVVFPTVPTTTVVPATTVAPAPTVPPPSEPPSPPSTQHLTAASSPGRCAGWEGTIAAYFPAEQVAKACSVMMCESGGNPTAENPRSTASGLWQFLDSTWVRARAMVGAEQYARASHAPGNVQTAAAAAWWRATSWDQWACS